mgnify:CR=1 FL=1
MDYRHTADDDGGAFITVQNVPALGLAQGAVLLADEQQGADHQDNSDGQSDDDVGQEAGDDVADEADAGNGAGIGHLSGHVVDVVALSAGGSHDGGVGNGRAVGQGSAEGFGYLR